MAAPTYTALLNGVDVSSLFVQDSWSVNQGFGRQGDTSTFYLHDDFTAPPGTPHITVPPLQSLRLTDTTTGALLFAGVAQTPKVALPAPNVMDWQLDALDYTMYTDNIIVNGDFKGQTADSIAKQLVAQANIGLTVANVKAAPVIARIQINYISLSAALTKLARMASQVSDYGWFIDYSYDLHFFSFTQAGTPTVSFTDNVTANPTVTNGFYAQDSTFAYEWDGGSLRNSCIVRGSNYQATRTDTWRADGLSTAWPLTYNIDTSVAATLLINGGVVKVTTVSPNGATPTTPYVITQNANGQWFLVERTGGPPTRGKSISLTYTYIAPIITRVDNRASQTIYNGLNGGVFQMEVTDSTLNNLSSAMARGNAELQAFQWVQERVTFTTLENWPGHVNAGDIISFTSARIPNSLNGYAPGITNALFLIITNQYIGIPGNYRRYTITATRIS